MTLKCVRSSLGGSVCCVAVLQGGRPTRVIAAAISGLYTTVEVQWRGRHDYDESSSL